MTGTEHKADFLTMKTLNGIGTLLAERKLLKQRFRARIEEFPAALVETAKGLNKRYPIYGDEKEESWLDRASDLVLLYPTLQAEGFPDLEAESVRAVNLSHAFFLAHSFLDDRALDGQLVLDAKECLFVKQLMLEGISILQSVNSPPSHVNLDLLALLRGYADAQCSNLRAESPLDSRDLRSLELIAGQRASLGFFSVLCLLDVAGAAHEETMAAREAFDAIAIGLQWADDAEDWREDLRTGDENLLLLALGISGSDARELTADEYRVPNISHAIVRTSSYEHAHGQALEYIGRARNLQSCRGCQQMCVLLDDLSQSLRERLPVLISESESEVISAVMKACSTA